MYQENRRSFVKKSLATSMTFTFSGLIRAHGEEGGGTTTWDSNQSTMLTSFSGTTAWNPDASTIETTIPVATTWNPDETTHMGTTVETTNVVFDLSGSAEAASTAIVFDETGYGQLPDDWAVGSIYKYKLKFFAGSVNAQKQPHGNPLKIEVSAEYYRIGGDKQYRTDRSGLECEVIDASNGTISEKRVGQVPEFLEMASAASKIEIKNADDEIIGYYLLYPKIKITNLEIKTSPENQPKSATLSGRVNFWTGVKKYEKSSNGTFVEVSPYDPNADPDYPGGSSFKDFEVTIASHAHVSH